MKKSTLLSDVLHILLHMSQSEPPLTSENLAKAMQSNPVVVRRTMAGLKKQGLVTSEKGHNGGWRLSCDLNAVTLHDIYTAIGTPNLITFGNRTNSSECMVEKAVGASINDAYVDAERVLIARFRSTTLAELKGNMGDVHRGRHS
jgi:DNA-binding IscR family transcriptional regulator